MDSRIKSLYVVIKSNRCLAFGNMKECVKHLQELEPECKSYSYFNREFKNTSRIEHLGYYIQKLI